VALLLDLDVGGGVVSRLDWPEITRHAAEIVGGYGTSVTLRQLFYRLVTIGNLPPRHASAWRRPSSRAGYRRPRRSRARAR
jgi:hypothetical protein